MNGSAVSIVQRKYNQAHHEKHKTEDNKYSGQYRSEHREHVLELNVEYRKTHQGYFRRKAAEWLRLHPEQTKAQRKRFHDTHLALWKQYNQNRRARLLEVGGTFTANEFEDLCKVFDYECFYCGIKTTLVADHFIPMSKGGCNSIENIVPACSYCNNSKSNLMPDEFIGYIKKCWKESVLR